LKLYPSDEIALGSEADDALRGLAEYEATSGNLARAANLYEDLLTGVLASEPQPRNNLSDAADLSSLYDSMTAIYRRTASPERALELDTRRRQLWEQWNGKLPANPFILRQIAQ
jgi:hypothetical protein